METTQGNKLIAEFMGCEYNPILLNFFIDHLAEGVCHHLYHDAEELRYHLSWDWLMPVVRKINELCHDHDNIDSEELFMSDEYTSILDTISIAVIEDAYKVVIEFIQYYNTLSPVMGSFDVNGDTI